MYEYAEKNNTRYIADVVGDSFMRWEPGDVIKITAPTGSGKSYFILHVLLKHAIRNGRRILYLVNRKILKSQLQDELNDRVSFDIYREFGPIQITGYIKIETYQHIENVLKSGNSNQINSLDKEMQYFDYVIYDECHYFYSDSNFNTSTELSFDYLSKKFFDRTKIFMSATMKNMQNAIEIQKK